MSEAVQLAKAAREHLAQALNALQSDDQVPADLVEVAEPIAKAMTVLHRVERTNGENLEGRDTALAAVRSALEKVQKVTDAHPSVDLVLEAVAGSLSKVHALARYAPPTAARQASPPSPSQPVARPTPAPPVPVARPTPAPPVPVARPTPAPAAPVARPTPAPAPRLVEAAPAPQPAPAAPVPPSVPAAAAREPTRPAAPEALRAASSTPNIDVELGTHSSSNFYKGLGGNDVIEHGGIFVATYRVPKIGALVSLRVLLPGDYEFQAAAVVQWTREGGGSTEPGFGARFTQISPDGRQLVYRYTRNREPMFYDDL
jgi:Tfp pilus assembly protein PilZ